MTTFIALFRGINVGGKNLLPMGQLVPLLEALGLQNVSTYIQSGNVVFQSVELDPADLAERIQSAVHESHGFTPQVFVLGVDELERAVRANPYPEAEPEPKSLHLSFLETRPQHPDLDVLEGLKLDSERFELRGEVFYLHAPEGIGRSKLAGRVERALGVSATGRNWRTVCRILEMARNTAGKG